MKDLNRIVLGNYDFTSQKLGHVSGSERALLRLTERQTFCLAQGAGFINVVLIF